MYVRNASGLVKDKAKLLHLLIMIFMGTWTFLRIGIWPVTQLWTGMNYEKLIPGKFCMMTNLTSTWHNKIDEDYYKRSSSFKLQVVVSMFLYLIAKIYFCLTALKAR